MERPFFAGVPSIFDSSGAGELATDSEAHIHQGHWL
jgi:hypothetical protein